MKTDQLKVDDAFVKKYNGSLISKGEAELIVSASETLMVLTWIFVDSVKYTQLEGLSNFFGMNLSLYALTHASLNLASRRKRRLTSLHHQ